VSTDKTLAPMTDPKLTDHQWMLLLRCGEERPPYDIRNVGIDLAELWGRVLIVPVGDVFRLTAAGRALAKRKRGEMCQVK